MGHAFKTAEWVMPSKLLHMKDNFEGHKMEIIPGNGV